METDNNERRKRSNDDNDGNEMQRRKEEIDYDEAKIIESTGNTLDNRFEYYYYESRLDININNILFNEDLKELINEYNNKYNKNLNQTLANYEEDPVFLLILKNKQFIRWTNKGAIITSVIVNGNLIRTGYILNKMNDFIIIVNTFNSNICKCINQAKNILNKDDYLFIIMNYIKLYNKYSALLSFTRYVDLKMIISLKELPFINYFKWDDYYYRRALAKYNYSSLRYATRRRWSLNELYNHLKNIIENINDKNMKIQIDRTLNPLYVPTKRGKRIIEIEESDEYNIKDFISDVLSYVERDFQYLFTYLYSICSSNEEIRINDVIVEEIKKLKSFIYISMYLPSFLKPAIHNNYLAFIIEYIPENQIYKYVKLFDEYDKLDSQAPSIYILLRLLGTFGDKIIKDAINNQIEDANKRIPNFKIRNDFNIVDYNIYDTISIINKPNQDIHYKNILLNFIKYNRGCSRIFYEIHIITDLKSSYNSFKEVVRDNLPIINVLGVYNYNTNNPNVSEEYFIPIRCCSLKQVEHEIISLKNNIGRYFEIYITFYTDFYPTNEKSKHFKYNHLNYISRLEPLGESNHNITADNGVRKLMVPINRLQDNFLTGGFIRERDDEIFEEYNKVNNNNEMGIFNFKCIKRIEINLNEIKGNNNVRIGGRYLPLRIKSNETNITLEDIANDLQLISIKSMFNIPLCCFAWAIIHTPCINNLLSIEEIEKIKIDFGYRYISMNEIKEFCKEYRINVNIKKFGYVNGLEKVESKIINIKGNDYNNRIITLGFIKYGTFTHYFPIFKTEITKFCCNNLNISNEEYYDIDAAGESRIENYNIIDGTPRRNLNKDKKIYADSYDVLEALIDQDKIEWASNFDNELFNYNIGNLPPNLKQIEKYNDIMVEKITYKEKDYKKLEYICAADTETYTEVINNREVLKPFCICCSHNVGGKYTKRNFYGENCQIEFLQYLCDNKIYKVYFHNLKFDGWLFKDFMIRNMIYHASKLYSITILYKRNRRNNMIEFYDSLALIPTALRNFPKMFNLDKMEKELYPYKLINSESIEKGYLEEEELRNYFKDEYNQFINQYKQNIKDNNYNIIDIKKLTIYYCQNDVDLLLKGLEKFELMGSEIFDGVSPLRFITISSYSYNIMVKNCFNGLDKYKGDIKNYIRKSIRGGRCMVRNNEKIKAEGEIVDFDACSLYPSAMNRLYLPTGDCYCSTDPNEVKRLFEENMMNEEQLEANNNKYVSYMILHIKIIKIKKERGFPLLSYQTNGINLYTNEMIGKEVYVTSIELEDFINYQEGEVDYLDAIYWIGNKDNRMSQYIAKCYNLRREYKKQGNPLQEVLKLFMNSSYGKTIQKDIKEEYKFDTPDNSKTYMKNNYGRIKEIIELNHMTWWIKLDGCSKPLAVPCHIGALILGMSKRIMNEVMCLAEDNNIPLYYQDTDSMHLRKEDVSVLENLFYNKFNRKLIGSDMGQFHIDFPLVDGKEPISRKSIFLGKKAYLDCLRNEDGKEDYFIRMKGVPDDVIINTCKDMHITVEELYERMYNGNEIDFNLLNSSKPKFEFTKDFQIMIKEKFSRKVKF